jgi:hypothetical protein
MTHDIEQEPHDRPRHAQVDSTPAIGFDDEALLDHHIEEMLTAFGDLGLPPLRGRAENLV